MAKIIYDLSGNSGLVEKYQGDIDGVSTPNIRYQGNGGQLAEGIINPLKRTGFTSAANTNFERLVDGLMIGSFVYDTDNDDIYAAEIGTKIYKLDGSDDLSYTTILDTTSSYEISDMDLYEVNGIKSLVYSANYKESTKSYQLGSTATDKYDYWRLTDGTQSFSPGTTGYGNGYFVSGGTGQSTLLVSQDGNSWSSVSGVSGQTTVGFIGYLNDRWISAATAGTNRIGYSYDLSTFSSVTTGDTQLWQGGAYGNSTYVLVGAVGGAKNVAYSTNGITWTTILIGAISFRSVSFGAGLFVGVGDTGAIYTSPDGITWTVRVSPAVNNWTSVTYGNGLFVTVSSGGTGRAIYSSDGITWTASTSMDADAPLQVAYGDGYFLSVCSGAVIYKSTDGITWTKLIISNLTMSGRTIAYGNGFFLVTEFGDNDINQTFTSTIEVEIESTTKNKATLGFISLDEDKGIYVASSQAKKVYPTTYNTQTIEWNSAQTITSVNQRLGQRVNKVNIIDSKIEKIRIGLISEVDEDTVVKVSVHDATVPYTGNVYSTTFTISSTDNLVYKEYYLDFGTLPELANYNYACLTIELYDITQTTLDGEIKWVSTPINSSLHEGAILYNGTAWSVNTQSFSFDFSVIKSELKNWTSKYITNAFQIDLTTDINFIRKADNGFLYWFTDNLVHSVDGGVSGGSLGILRKNLLLFPAYLRITDAVDARSRMFIALQSTTRDQEALAASANIIGVYIWDRLSSVTNFRDFIAIPGIKEIKSLFIDSTGTVNAICIGNDKFVQLRQYTGNEFKLIKTLGTQAYPTSQRGINSINNVSYWFGQDGILYLYGSVMPGGDKELYKFASLGTDITTTGAVMTADNSTGLGNIKILASYKTALEEGIKFFSPYGTDYNTGNSFYTQIKILPSLSTIKNIRVLHLKDLRTVLDESLQFEDGVVFDFQDGLPITTFSFSQDEIVAELSCFINMNSTAEWTRNITLLDLQRGYIEKEYNKNNVNSIQFKVTWLNKAYSLGDFMPMYIEVNTAEEQRPVSK
jgi:hypothetical protein